MQIIKFFWSALDRVFFITMGVIGTIATTYITGILKINPPELVVMQTYNHIDNREVASSVGSLKINYKKEEALSYGVYRVDIKNDGRGPAEDVRFQVKIPGEIVASYYKAPDFKVYRPKLMEFKGNEFYLVFPKFPAGAADSVAFRVGGDERKLCSLRVKFVSEDYEGEVKGLQGVECE